MLGRSKRSALGQTPTFAAQKAKSAIRPTADFDHVELDVGLGPERDIKN
jgi:hypothetical protein